MKNLTNTPKRLQKRRFCTLAEIDKSLIEFIDRSHRVHMPLSDDILAIHATDAARILGYAQDPESVTISRSWISRFKKRNGYESIRISGEIGSNDRALAMASLPGLREIISEYPPCAVYNFDETALFWKCMPVNTIVNKQQDFYPGMYFTIFSTPFCCILILYYSEQRARSRIWID